MASGLALYGRSGAPSNSPGSLPTCPNMERSPTTSDKFLIPRRRNSPTQPPRHPTAQKGSPQAHQHGGGAGGIRTVGLTVEFARIAADLAEHGTVHNNFG